MNIQENISRIREIMGLNESFVTGVWSDDNNNYSVDKLVKLVSDRKPVKVSINQIIEKNIDLDTKEGNFYTNIIEPTELFKKRAMKSNTIYPIMISEEGWIIDGSHRVAKQKWMGKKYIKAHIITKQDLEITKITDNDELKKSSEIKY